MDLDCRWNRGNSPVKKTTQIAQAHAVGCSRGSQHAPTQNDGLEGAGKVLAATEVARESCSRSNAWVRNKRTKINEQ